MHLWKEKDLRIDKPIHERRTTWEWIWWIVVSRFIGHWPFWWRDKIFSIPGFFFKFMKSIKKFFFLNFNFFQKFKLGVFCALEQKDLLKKIDYLSCVSGGGCNQIERILGKKQIPIFPFFHFLDTGCALISHLIFSSGQKESSFETVGRLKSLWRKFYSTCWDPFEDHHGQQNVIFSPLRLFRISKKFNCAWKNVFFFWKTKSRLHLTDLTPSSTINLANETLQRAFFTLRNQMRAHHSWVKKLLLFISISISQNISKNYCSSFGGKILLKLLLNFWGSLWLWLRLFWYFSYNGLYFHCPFRCYQIFLLEMLIVKQFVRTGIWQVPLKKKKIKS